MQLFIEAYPWDLLGEGVDDVLGRLRGEVGADGICIWAAARPITVLRARPCETRVFRSRGGLYFQPRRQYYEGTRCRPLVSSWSHSGERFARAVDACRRNAMDVRFMLTGALVGRLAEHYPEFAARNAYGAESSQSLCLNNPDVRSYLAAAVSDLTAQFQSSAVVVTDFNALWQEAFDPRLDGTQRLDVSARELLATCFCRSCCRRAEEARIDANEVIREVQDIVNACVGLGGASIAIERTRLDAYRRLQQEHLSLLAEELDDACACKFVLDTGDPAFAETWQSLRDRGMSLATYARSGGEVSAMLSSGRNSELRLPVWSAVDGDAPDLVSAVRSAALAGCEALSMDHLGLMPDASLPALKQATRFARRSVENTVAAG